MFNNLKARFYFFRLLLAGLSFAGCQSSESQKAEPANNSAQDSTGAISIFDGKTLDGWEGDTAVWHVEDGAIVGQVTASSTPLKANTFLIWKKGEPSDFELTGEYQISAGIDVARVIAEWYTKTESLPDNKQECRIYPNP